MLEGGGGWLSPEDATKLLEAGTAGARPTAPKGARWKAVNVLLGLLLTCAGVGIGFNPPKYLHKGDVVAITIEPIGTLENPVE